MTEFIQVMTTTETQKDATKIAQTLVERRLAGCVQVIGPITSVYRWQGDVETAQEWLCLIKSHRDRYDELAQAIRQVHPYDVPEILAVPIVAGNPGYLEWLQSALAAGAA
jgi:periplasmic divalent cation tolerance protein